jgi:competence protein ComFC
MRSWSIFEGSIRHALHSLKYRRNVALGDALAVQFASFAITLGWPVDLVVPIPLGKERMKERGYNQTGLVALPMSAILRKPYSSRALTRCRDNRTQVGLTPLERRENVRGAFRAESGLVKGMNILLMDDIATTGATLASGASALLEAGARSVYGLTLARALPVHGLKSV